MKLVLLELNSAAPSERSELVAFVNSNYPSEFPVQESSIISGKMTFFWAIDATTRERVGVTAYMSKTPFLVETIKTVIDPKHRRQGLGSVLSQLIEDEVRRRGFKKIMTTIYTSNLPMIFIKLKQGYRFEGFHPSHEKPGLDEYSLGKLI